MVYENCKACQQAVNKDSFFSLKLNDGNHYHPECVELLKEKNKLPSKPKVVCPECKDEIRASYDDFIHETFRGREHYHGVCLRKVLLAEHGLSTDLKELTAMQQARRNNERFK